MRIGVGSVGDRPLLLTDLSARVSGHVVDSGLAREIGAGAAAFVDPADGLHASAAYQRHLTGHLVERALLRAWANADGEGEP